MYTQKMHPATTFPDINVTLSNGESVSLTSKEEGCDWKKKQTTTFRSQRYLY
ncbi:hypothetical protein [Alteromonas gracilis]|uniref:hypothetical protein n=1 Tax=Alteromonas gracilis TaxID=1479524 RepID=UPI003B42F434